MCLPEFPTFRAVPTDDQLERRISTLMDCADAALMAGRITQAEYDAFTRELDRWASSITTRRAD